MSQLVEQLANLTSLRDRDALDITLVQTIHDLVQPQSASMLRIVGDDQNERWLISARWDAGQSTHTCDSAWANLMTLPAVCAHPYRQQALATRQVVQTDGEPHLTIFPLKVCPGVVGVLEIASHEALSQAQVTLVNGVLRLYLNFQSLLDYGERDALTDLLNRKTFDGAFLKATIEQQMTEKSEQGHRQNAISGTYWLAMLDIDHFKRVNDNYGHLIGDEVLLLLAQLMRASFRFHDQLYRFGGEEFVVLMRCDNEQEAFAALERLRITTEKHLFPQVGHITVSIGFSEIKKGDSPSGAFERADRAVYFAKQHGRNQVSSFAALISSGELEDQAVNIGDMELF